MVADLHSESHRGDALPVCLGGENPHRLVSLWDMRFHAMKAMEALELIAKMEMASTLGYGQIPSPTFYEVHSKTFDELETVLCQLGLTGQADKAAELGRFMRIHNATPGLTSIKNLSLLIHHDLDKFAFEAIPSDLAKYYNHPLEGWTGIIERFGCSWDIEEASKCLALVRSTACVFHLMRVAERGVLDLQTFLERPDPKAHFGSVVAKLDALNTKTKFQELPEHLKPYRDFLIEIMAPLHAVKMSWRDKVAHVDGKIIPSETFTQAMALGVYEATVLFMGKLAAGMPPKVA
jgi:hypothetical protein